MAIRELFNDARPQILFDPRGSERIDPRFKYTRNSPASYYDRSGLVKIAPPNEPRLSREPLTGVTQGFQIEPTSTNRCRRSDFAGAVFFNSGVSTVSDSTVIAPDGSNSGIIKVTAFSGNSAHGTNMAGFTSMFGSATAATGSIYVKKGTWPYVQLESRQPHGGFRLWIFDLDNKTGTSNYEELPNGWFRLWGSRPDWFTNQNGFSISLSASATNFLSWDASGTESIYIWGPQLEPGTAVTSYIPTTGDTTVTRAPDLCSIETSLPASGSIFIDSRSVASRPDETLLTAANSSNEKIALAIRRPANLFNSTALVYEVEDQFKPTLPFPVPTVIRERNLITYGTSNYHYRTDSSRFTPSSSIFVPDNMNVLGVGHDVTDPVKSLNGYVSTVYLWPGEISPAVAEALVRGDVDPKNADSGSFTPVAGSLAFAFNTQGTGTSGDRIAQLPLRGSNNNVVVSWGDNTSSSLIGSAASVTVNHTYPSAGIYPVQIEADSDGTNSGLENLEFTSSSPADLVRVLQWGGTTTFNPTTMYRIFRDCVQLDFEAAARTNLPDTSAIADWREAFYNCQSLSGQFPNFDLSAATNVNRAWYNCFSLETFGSSIDELAPTSTDFTDTWRNCSSLTSFPQITLPTTNGNVNLSFTWAGCSSLTSFPASINTSAATIFFGTWDGCSSITSFTGLNTANGTDFRLAWNNCSSLTNFTLTNFSSATTLTQAFSNWSSYATAFPAITTSNSLINLNLAWSNTKMTSFSAPTNTSQVSDFSATWENCTGLTNFPFVDTSSATTISRAWQGCTNIGGTFPSIDTSNVSSFGRAWNDCSSIQFLPSFLDTSNGQSFALAWRNMSSITSFPSYNFSSANAIFNQNELDAFFQAWFNCTSLTTFPANVFDTCPARGYTSAFQGCALTAQSIENILVSINTARVNLSVAAGRISVNLGSNAAKSTWTTAANNAYTDLTTAGWIIDVNP